MLQFSHSFTSDTHNSKAPHDIELTWALQIYGFGWSESWKFGKFVPGVTGMCSANQATAT